MKSEKDSKVDSGVPRPYKSSTLLTPGNVIGELVSPLHVWQAVVVLSVVMASIVSVMHLVFGLSLNISAISIGGVAATAIIGFSIHTAQGSTRSPVPSISDVYLTKRYTELGTNIGLITLLMGFLVLALLVSVSILSGTTNLLTSISRLAIMGMMSIAFGLSYVIVRTLSSHAPQVAGIPGSQIIKNNSIPEFIAAVALLGTPVLIGFTALQTSISPPVRSPWVISATDVVVFVSVLQVAYLTAISRL